MRYHDVEKNMGWPFYAAVAQNRSLSIVPIWGHAIIWHSEGEYLTHCPLGDVTVILDMYLLIILVNDIFNNFNEYWAQATCQNA